MSLGSNSPLELHSADFRIFGDFADSSLVSAPKILKNYESQTENPSVVVALPRIYESKRESIISRHCEKIRMIFVAIHPIRHCEANRRFAEAIQNKNKSARSATLKASSGAVVGVVREGEGSDFAIRKNPCIQAPTHSLKENTHSQKGDSNADLSAESRYKIVSKINFSKVPIQ